MRVLILNIFSRNALAVINGLKGQHTLFGAATLAKGRKTALTSFLKSPALDDLLHYTNPIKDEQRFVNDVVELCNAHHIDVVIPTGTTVTNVLSKHKAALELATTSKMAVENYEKLEQLADKWYGVEVCQKIGVPVPKSAQFSYEKGMPNDIDQFTFPVVVKPRISYASIGVAFYDTRDALAHACATQKDGFAHSDGLPFVMQEVITGNLHDVAACGQQGNTIATITQQRLVSLYDFGGGGIINITTNEPELKEYATKLVEALQWNGPIICDFIKDTNGAYYMLECNPKIWGTTELTIEAGINMPQLMCQLFTSPRMLETNNTYTEGLLYRWWYPECVYHWYQRDVRFGTLLKRMARTMKRYHASRRISNIRLGNIRHLIGLTLNRSKL